MTTDQNLLKPILSVAAATLLILAIPFTAMQFTGEVDWTLSDFVIMGIILFSCGMGYKLITRTANETFYRIAIAYGIFTGFLLLWVNAAVGLIGSEDNMFNLLYLAVLAVGAIGGAFYKFAPRGMSYTFVAMASVQAILGITALLAGMQHVPHSSVIEIIGVNGFFITLFLIAAIMFHHVANDREKTTLQQNG
ncbi:MAG TPA: hypothetical protein DCE78_07290 [Bacteroidetes bacterium]|nr:hypothetical protein [Bacteroidota bacterium]